MAKIVANPKLELSLSFTINESEAWALDALVGYNFDSFVKVFKENLGESYLRGHEEGLKTFFESIRQLVPLILSDFKEAKEIFNK